MIIKLDLANAFDRVRYEFLFHVMQRFSFDPSFINWIQACVKSPWISPLVNGQAANFFQASRGLRRVFPLSPLLYTIQALFLNFQLNQSQLNNDLIELRIATSVKDINHALFRDDTILLGGASVNSIDSSKRN